MTVKYCNTEGNTFALSVCFGEILISLKAFLKMPQNSAVAKSGYILTGICTKRWGWGDSSLWKLVRLAWRQVQLNCGQWRWVTVRQCGMYNSICLLCHVCREVFDWWTMCVCNAKKNPGWTNLKKATHL